MGVLLMKCADCGNWTIKRVTIYDDGSEVENYCAPEGKGHCDHLNQDFGPDFGCIAFVPGIHVHAERKSGAPWQHWRMITCPDCAGHPGRGAGGRCRCAGTGLVRLYDDGYVGEEQTRKHPKEKELASASKIDPGTIIAPTTVPNVFDSGSVP
jgi:hypothetical protein